MDIPIKFKFFDKLKLYQDYLKEDSMLEKTKSEYWLFEKSIMLWAYSGDHEHLGVPLDITTFINKADKILEGAKKIGGSNYKTINWVKENATNKKAIPRIIENLITLELVTELETQLEKKDSKEYSRKIAINLRGFLLGELLFETYEQPGFWSNNFRKYKITLLTFYLAFIILFITIFLVFLNQLFQLIKPENFVTMGTSIGKCTGCSWWSIITSCFLIFLGLRQIWRKL